MTDGDLTTATVRRYPPPTTIAGKRMAPSAFGFMSLCSPAPSSPPPDYPTAARVLQATLPPPASDQVVLWNAGAQYGSPDSNSLHLLARYLTDHPSDASRVLLSLKGAYDGQTHTPQCSPASIRASVDEALAILQPAGITSIDIFSCSRVDPAVPIETSIAALAELVKEGKVGAIGLSEVSAATIRRAAKVAPIAAVELELSLFTTDALQPDQGGGDSVASVCRELAIPMVAYRPLGLGFLTGAVRSLDDIPANDVRRWYPRFHPDAFADNLKLVEAVEEIARGKGDRAVVTAAQVAMAWVRAQGALPLYGTSSEARVAENSVVVELADAELARLADILERLPVSGGRYPEAFMKHLSQ